MSGRDDVDPAMLEAADEWLGSEEELEYYLDGAIPPYVHLPPGSWDLYGVPSFETSEPHRYIEYPEKTQDEVHLLQLNPNLCSQLNQFPMVRAAWVPRVFWEFMHPKRLTVRNNRNLDPIPIPEPVRILRFLFYQSGVHLDQLLYIAWFWASHNEEWEDMGINFTPIRTAGAGRFASAA